MNIFLQFASVAAIVATGAAVAQPADAPHRDRNADVTRQQAVEHADRRFQRLDLNNDGRATREEAQQARQQHRAERRTQRADRMFERLDLDRNGSVTREEMNRAHEQRLAQRAGRGEHGAGHGQGMGRRHGGFMRGMHHGGGHGMRGERLFGEQGFVTREQMRERALAHFDRLDADRNGTLTAAERQQARQRMRERMHERMDEARPASN